MQYDTVVRETFTTRVTMGGRVLHFDPQPLDVTSRSPSVSPVKGASPGAPDSKTVCDILLDDNTGPVMLTLWGKNMNEFYSKIGHTNNPIVFASMNEMWKPANAVIAFATSEACSCLL